MGGNTKKLTVLSAAWTLIGILAVISLARMPKGRSNNGCRSSVGRARDYWCGGFGFDSHCGRTLPTGWVGVSIVSPAETEVMVSSLYFVCGST